MSYTPHEWQNDELITAAKMNNIEEGIAAGGGGASGLCVLTDGTLDKSYNDLLGMVNSGIIPFIYDSNGYLYLLGSCDINQDGITFFGNSQVAPALFFYAPDDDADANLLLD